MERTIIKDTIKHIKERVKICGWVDAIRSHGKILFVDLRDRNGLLQVVFTSKNEKLYELAKTLKPEWVIAIQGEIKERPKAMVNPKLETGRIELTPEKLEILSEAKTLPFPIDASGYEINEEKRLKYFALVKV